MPKSINGVSRRQVLAGVAAGLTAGLTPIVGTRSAQSQAPKRGGHLVIGLDGATTTQRFDPALFAQSHDTISGLQVYNTLTEMGDNSDIQPALAEAWDSNQDLTVWTFKLRGGVTFHNGKTLAPADVIYSINHHRGEKSTSAAVGIVSQIADIKAGSASEIIFTLSSGNADFPALLSDYHLCIAPEGSNFSGIGTGAFILETIDPGVRVLTKRNPNYWRADRGFVDSVETLGINDIAARTNALITGACHIVNRVDPRTAARLRGMGSVELFDIAGTGFNTYSMRCDVAPYDNVDLRLAMKYAIDREEIVRKVLLGFGSVGNDHPISSASPVFAADIPQRAFDPDKAKFHFKKSGITGPLPMSVNDVGWTGASDAAQLFKQTAAKAGMDLAVEEVSADGYMDNVWGKAQCFPSYWNGRLPDAIFSIAYKSDAAWNETHWKNAEFDKLLIAARGERDVAKRTQMYQDMQRMIHDEGGTIVPAFFNIIDAGQKSVGGFVRTPFAEFSGYRAPERVWLVSQ